MLKQCFKENKCTKAVSFGMEKAYDTVWRAKITNSLHNMGLGKSSNFSRECLTDRELCARVVAFTQNIVYQAGRGSPQGSMFSVTCFPVTINDIFEQLSHDVLCALYIDDFTVFFSTRNKAHSCRAIQIPVRKLV